MAEAGSTGREDPIIQPRLVRFLKNRPRAIDAGIREEVLEGMERRIAQRRKPDTVAEKMIDRAFNEVADAAAPPFRDRARNRLENANQGILRNM